VLDVPLGAENVIEPAAFDGAQPTHFTPGREWGAFGVVVPGDYSGPPVKWTLRVRGKTFAVPANMTAEWKIDALLGDAEGNLPPELAGLESGPWGAGPGGIHFQARARAGTATTLTVWVRDDGHPGGGLAGASGRVLPVTLTWFGHSGPGPVGFEGETTARIPVEGGSMSARVTFPEPGEYIVRVRANDSSGVAGAGHSQCCWSNAFINVTVTG
jgi:hypothetical protein